MSNTCASLNAKDNSAEIDDLMYEQDDNCPKLSDNLVSLSVLNPESVLTCIQNHFICDKIYTWAGSTLVACNPFKEIDYLYDGKQLQTFSNVYKEQKSAHIYSIASRAYCNICCTDNNVDNNAIVISGESGSGKTCSVKHILKFLSYLENNEKSGSERSLEIQKWVMDTNPILEAFGNAATERNGNSSRFGKFLKLYYANGRLISASISTYLLEKTRVICKSRDAIQNFHIFYHLYSDANKVKELMLPENNDDILYNAVTYSSDQDQLLKIVKALSSINITDDKQECIFKTLSAILHLNRLSFALHNNNEDSYTIDITNHESYESLITICNFLGLEENHFVKIISNKTITTGGNGSQRRSIFQKPCTSKLQCQERAHCLAMLLYCHIFDWIVMCINLQLDSKANDLKCIGILDIFGFEEFAVNGFEQLCINYTNERIQQLFIKHFLNDEQLLFKEEAIDINFVEYQDNRPCLSLLDSNISVFGILNEKCKLISKSNPEDICSSMSSHLSKYDSLIKIKSIRRGKSKNEFTIKHYAGCVTYNTLLMIERNKDNVPAEIVKMLCESTNQFISKLFSFDETDDRVNKFKRKQTVLSKFKSSLDSLLNTISSSKISYIRCIKPNRKSLSGQFDREYVGNQLNACGIYETIAISRISYPIRYLYIDFIRRFNILLRVNDEQNKENLEPSHQIDKRLEFLAQNKRQSVSGSRRRGAIDVLDHQRQVCATILKSVKPTSNFQFGKTRLFLSNELHSTLEAITLRFRVKAVWIIKRSWRNFIFKKRLKEIWATEKIKAALIGWLFKLKYQKMKKSAITIQKYFRYHLQSQRIKMPSNYATNRLAESPMQKKRNIPYIIAEINKSLRLVTYFNDVHNKSFFWRNGILSVRRIHDYKLKFHTKASGLANSHICPLSRLHCSLIDAIS